MSRRPGAAAAELHHLNWSLELCVWAWVWSGGLVSVSFQQNGSHVSYYNVIESEREARGGVISRSFQLEVNFSCIYAYEQVVKLPFALTAVDK